MQLLNQTTPATAKVPNTAPMMRAAIIATTAGIDPDSFGAEDLRCMEMGERVAVVCRKSAEIHPDPEADSNWRAD